MSERSFAAATPAHEPRGPLDESLWRRIDTAVGEPTRFHRLLMIEGRAPQTPILVVVVERCGLPNDQALHRRFGLTLRESEVARLMADRLTNPEIARRLGISVHTVRRHAERVLGKLGLHSRTEVRAALQDSQVPVERLPRRIVA